MREYKTWTDARTHCESLNGLMLEVRSLEELQIAIMFVNATGHPSIWLGGTDKRTEGRWKWNSDNTNIDMNSFWQDNQPSQDTGDEDYLAVHFSGVFFDARSHQLKPFVCTIL